MTPSQNRGFMYLYLFLAAINGFTFANSIRLNNVGLAIFGALMVVWCMFQADRYWEASHDE